MPVVFGHGSQIKQRYRSCKAKVIFQHTGAFHFQLSNQKSIAARHRTGLYEKSNIDIVFSSCKKMLFVSQNDEKMSRKLRPFIRVQCTMSNPGKVMELDY